MLGGKYDNAISGINEEQNVLRGNPEINYTQTVIEFDSDFKGLRTHEHYFMTPIEDTANIIGVGANGGTPLNQALGELLERLFKHVKHGEKVVVTVFTDGGENASQGTYRDGNALRHTIKLCERLGYTITFMGTKFDVNAVVANLGIHASNTLSHNNTAEGIAASYKTRGASLSKLSADYSSLHSAGAVTTDSLTKGFFTEEEK
jgi:hypothetical protein